MHNNSYLSKIDYYLLFLIFCFSIFIRIFFVFFYDYNSLVLHNADGFTFAEAVRDIVNGFHQQYDQSKIDQPLAIFTAFLVKILPFSLDSIIFYLSAIVGSLVVFPIFFIAKELNLSKIVAYYSVFFISVSSVYFHRTLAGYYDTDMAVLVFILSIIYFIIKAINSYKEHYHLIAAFLSLIYLWYYPQSHSILFSTFMVLGFYALKNDDDNQKKLFLILLTTVLKISIYLKVLLIFIIFKFFDRINTKVLLLSLFVIFMVSGGFLPIYEKISIYLDKSSTIVTKDNLHYFNLISTIAESNKTDPNLLIVHSTSTVIFFVVAVAFALFLFFNVEYFLLFLPLFLLGILSFKLGLRFLIFLTPIFAFSLGEAFYFLIEKRTKFLSIILIAPIYLNLVQDLSFKPQPLVSQKDIKILKEFKDKSKRDDYVLAWWDYGYIIKYYCDVNVICDGSRQGNSNLFLISKILTSTSPLQAYNLSLLSSYYTHNFYKNNLGHYGQFEQMLKDFNYKDPNKFLKDLKTSRVTLKKEFDTYIYLDRRYLDIFGLLKMFGDRDLLTGEIAKRNFVVSKKIENNRDFMEIIDIANNKIVFDKINFLIKSYSKDKNKYITFKLNKYIEIENEEIKTKLKIYPEGKLNMIFLDKSKVILLDNDSFNSFFIQMFFFKNYNEELFEPIIDTDDIKIYKVL